MGVGADATAPSAASPPVLAATLRALGLRPADAAAGATGVPTTPPWGAPVAAGGAAGDWQAVDPDALFAGDGVRPMVLGAGHGDPSADGGAHLVSAAGTLAWRPPLDALGELPALAAHALRLRFLVDAAEHHAVAAAWRYARAAEHARRTAALLGAHELSTIAVSPALFVEVDALLGAAGATLEAVARLVEGAYGTARRGAAGAAPASPRRARFDARLLRVRAAPPELRDTLLAVWEAHGAYAAGLRRAVRRAAAAELGPPTVRVQQPAAGVWSVRLPVAAEPSGIDAGGVGRRGRQDALGLAWTFATEAWRATTLAVYAAAAER